MEQTVIDFFAKSSELILHNRLATPKVADTSSRQITPPNQFKFQLSFDQKFNFNSKIPSQWTSHGNKLLVLEFSLCNKATGEKFLAEQWFFELNQGSDRKLKDTIDSPNTLYKKLSVLLRSISLLTVTLPLHKSFIADKNSQLVECYTLEHSIHFTSHTLSNWHSKVYEEKSLATHSNPDFVLPGKAFIFKVNYARSLNFLQAMVDGHINHESTHLNVLREKLDLDYFNPKKRNRATSNGTPCGMRKSTSDSNGKINTSTGGNTSPKESYPVGSEGVSENLSPFGSLFTASPIETQIQMSPKQIAELKMRKNSGGSYPWEGKNSAGNRPRFGTVDSHSSGEYDMYIYENEEFTEVVSVREIDHREESPRKFSVHPRASEDEFTFTSAGKKVEPQDLKLSGNSRPIEMLIEQSDDDKLADILKVIDELKDHYHLSFTQEINEQASSKATGSREDSKIEKKGTKGFKFCWIKEEDRSMPTLSSDYENLKDLYAKLKK